MSNYSYVALDSGGHEQQGSVDGSDQNEALRRIREMGFFPTRIARAGGAASACETSASTVHRRLIVRSRPGFLTPVVRGKALGIFTRQLATLLGAGLQIGRAHV